MQKNVLLAVLALATLALAAVTVRQRSEMQALRAATEHLKDELAVARTTAATERAAVAKRVAAQVRAAAPSHAPVAKAPAPTAPAVTALAEGAAPPPAHAAAAGSTNAAPFAGIAKMMRNPGMKSMIRAQQAGQMDMQYGALFKGLALAADQQEALKNLLLDKQMALVDLSMGMMDGSLTPEQRKEAGVKMAETIKAFDEKVKALLGDEDYPVYKEYEDTQPERTQVNLFKQTLSGNDQLSAQQENDLIRALYDERKAFPLVSKQYDHTTPPDPAKFTETGMADQLKELEQLQEKNLARAGAVLTGPQLEQFKKSQEQLRALQEMGMKMASQMFGKPGTDGGAKAATH